MCSERKGNGVAPSILAVLALWSSKWLIPAFPTLCKLLMSVPSIGSLFQSKRICRITIINNKMFGRDIKPHAWGFEPMFVRHQGLDPQRGLIACLHRGLNHIKSKSVSLVYCLHACNNAVHCFGSPPIALPHCFASGHYKPVYLYALHCYGIMMTSCSHLI